MIAQANLNGYAESNNLIILYPQAIAAILSSNPNGCWDWWGYTGSFGSSTYATHGGPQMEIVRAVIKDLGFKGKSEQNDLPPLVVGQFQKFFGGA